MLKRIVSLLFALLLVCPAGAALAYEYTLSPMVGAYIFEGNQPWKNSPVYSLGVGINFNRQWSLEAFGDFAEPEREGTSEEYNFYSGRIGALYHFNPFENLTPYLMAGVGALRINGDDDGQLTWGLGGKLAMTENVALRFEGRHVIGIETDSDHNWDGTYNHFAFTAGLTFTVGSLDEPAAEYQRIEEEPAAEVEEAAPKAAPVTAVKDSDKDGVIDVLDRCPVTPPGTPVDAEGCPQTVKFVDSDGDGVADSLDACPQTPESTVVDVRGCPELLFVDSDGDGVGDDQDRCSGTEAGIPVDATGCPELSEKLKIAGLVIEYATSQSSISEEAARELKLLAAKVNSTDRGRLMVEGHTDSVGSEAYNLLLSQERADKVRNSLISDYGVPPERVVAKGFGPYEPVADNSTQEGRQQNRRVVIRYEP